MKQLRWCKDSASNEHMLEMQRRNLIAAETNQNEDWMNTKLLTTGHRWTRQAIWGYRLFDFWNSQLGIAVEVDGPEHEPHYDAYRDEYNFRRSGIVVLRVKNRSDEDASRAIEFISNATTLIVRKQKLGIDENKKRLSKLDYPPSLLDQFKRYGKLL